MKLTVPPEIVEQVFKDPSQVTEGDGLKALYLPGALKYSLLEVVTKTDAIPPDKQDWWTKGPETSFCYLLCLDEIQIGDPDPSASYEVVILRSENGVERIKAVSDIGLWEISGDLSFFGFGLREESIVSVTCIKKITRAEWPYYMDLMRMNELTLRLAHQYDQRLKQEVQDEVEDLRPKSALAIVSGIIFVVLLLFGAYGSSLGWAGLLITALSPINYFVKYSRWQRAKRLTENK